MTIIVVGFRFKPTVSEEDKQRLIREMVGLKKNCVKEDGKPYILVSLSKDTGIGIPRMRFGTWVLISIHLFMLYFSAGSPHILIVNR
jgi:hypothetical protein